MGQLDGQVAAILHAGSPVGQVIATALWSAGADVVAHADPAEGGAALPAGDRVSLHAGSAADRQVVEGLVDAAVGRHGRLDVLVLAPGAPPRTVALTDTTDEDWRREVAARLDPVFWGLRRALHHMAPRRSGRVIVVSSVEGKLARAGLAGYTASQHAVCGLVKAAAQEVGTREVMVNAVLVGPLADGAAGEQSAGAAEVHSALGRPVTAEEVAAAVVLLASPASAGITGCMFPVDGGVLPY